MKIRALRVCSMTAVLALVSSLSVAAPREAWRGDDLRTALLRCEYRVNPVGIDEPAPRLSWMVESGARGQRQTAFRVLVARTAATLAKDTGDLWDSGRVAGGDTTALVYAGPALASNARAFWKVMVWDRDGLASKWSDPAEWSAGLLKPGDWKAQWIGLDATRPVPAAPADFGDAKWIWFARDAAPKKPAGKRAFSAPFVLPDGVAVTSAELLATGDDVLSAFVNRQRVLAEDRTMDAWKNPRVTDVSRFVQPGTNVLRAVVENATESPAGFLARLRVSLADGRTVTLVSDAQWQATDKAGADPLTNAAAWSACAVIGPFGIEPWGRNFTPRGLVVPPAALLRHDFTAAKPVARATLYASAFGWFDAFVNGRRVGDERFSPGWTDYRTRVYYRAWDVTALVRPGANALGAMLSDGWYSGYIGWYGQRDHYGKKPRFLGQLELEYADGTRETVATGPDWQAATGPVTGADILMGEAYDARLERAGWAASGGGAAGTWSAPQVGAELTVPVQAHPGPPVVNIGEFRAQKITEPAPGVYVLDLGQNFAGVVRLTVRGEPGQTITLRHAERLNPDGTLYLQNLRAARATDTYVCRGGGEETWEPRFTFHGFQYVEVTGLKSKPGPDTVVGVALSSDTPVAGSFDSPDAMVNRLWKNAYWTQRANFIDIPTDCPQRDERLGWTGDAQVYVRTATLHADVQAFFTKWLVDLEDAQLADGLFPKVAPRLVADGEGGPAWADAGVICPWTIYEVYGDRRVLERRYASMKKYVDATRARSTPEGLPPAKYHCYGDWLSIKADTPKDLIHTAYFAGSARLLGRAAEVLGRTDDAKEYGGLYGRIRAGFNRAFVAPDGRIKGDTQAGYVLALAFDLLDAENAEKAARYLVEDIEKRDGHLSTGFIGTKDLMLVLAKIGRNDVAFRLLHNETFPSWGFSIKHGATSIWERWDGWTPDKGFQTPGMNSFAHYSFGAVCQWMVENIGGIRAAAPAYGEIALRPEPDPKLEWADVAYDSVRGRIESGWRVEQDATRFRVAVPANTTATLALPAATADGIREGGRAWDGAKGVRLLGPGDGRIVFGLESGRYDFTVPRAAR